MFPLLSGTPTYHLPPLKTPTGSKKKSSKHCFLCGKKTGLATSYECRYKRSLTCSLLESKSNVSLFVSLFRGNWSFHSSSFCLSAISPVETCLFTACSAISYQLHQRFTPRYRSGSLLSRVLSRAYALTDATVCNSNLLKLATCRG